MTPSSQGMEPPAFPGWFILYAQLKDQQAFDQHESYIEEASLPADTLADRLRELDELKAEGLLSEAEYAEKSKQRLEEM